MDPSCPIYFQHIPKTAGVSLTTSLRLVFGAQLCPAAHWDHIALMSSEQIREYTAFAGHYAAYLSRFLRRRVNAFTFLREPVDRTISHYSHIRRDENHPFHQKVQGLSLLEFVEAPVTRTNVENYQARYLADFGYDPAAIMAAGVPPTSHDFPLQMHIDDLSLRESPADLRSRAIAALDDFVLIGVVDNFSVELRRLAGILGVTFGPPVRANVSPERHTRYDLDAQTLRAIRAATEVDQELYELVRDRRVTDEVA